MDGMTLKEILEEQAEKISDELKNIYLPYETDLILCGKRAGLKIAIDLIAGHQYDQTPSGSEALRQALRAIDDKCAAFLTWDFPFNEELARSSISAIQLICKEALANKPEDKK